MQTYAEQRAGLDARRASAVARMKALNEESVGAGETMNASQEEEFETLEKDVEAIDAETKRVSTLEKLNVEKAVPAAGLNSEDATRSRGGVQVQVRGDNVPKGIRFIRYALAQAGAMATRRPADVIAKQLWPDTPEVEMVLRTAVAAGNTTDSAWASPLVPLQNMESEFIDLLRPATIIGRIPGLHRVPFNVKIPRALTDPSVGWVGEGAVKPVSSMTFDTVTLLFNKVAGIVPITEELWRYSNPDAEMTVRNGLINAIAYRTDRDFLDPTKAETVGVSPASITYGVTPVTATGTTADALRDDLGSLLSAYAAANMSFRSIVLIMTAQQAVKIALMRNSLGQREFDGLTKDGGMLEGIPVITSENIVSTGGSPIDGYPIVAVNAADVLFAEGDGVEIDMSREASIQMDTSPDSPETSSTTFVSAWQRNFILLKAELFTTWKVGRTGAVQFIQNAKYQ